MDKSSSPEIICGITEYDETMHISTGRYSALGDEVEVVEVAHEDKLLHLGDRWPVFTRIISNVLLEQRMLDYSSDPDIFKQEHIKNL